MNRVWVKDIEKMEDSTRTLGNDRTVWLSLRWSFSAYHNFVFNKSWSYSKLEKIFRKDRKHLSSEEIKNLWLLAIFWWCTKVPIQTVRSVKIADVKVLMWTTFFVFFIPELPWVVGSYFCLAWNPSITWDCYFQTLNTAFCYTRLVILNTGVCFLCSFFMFKSDHWCNKYCSHHKW